MLCDLSEFGLARQSRQGERRVLGAGPFRSVQQKGRKLPSGGVSDIFLAATAWVQSKPERSALAQMRGVIGGSREVGGS